MWFYRGEAGESWRCIIERSQHSALNYLLKNRAPECSYLAGLEILRWPWPVAVFTPISGTHTTHLEAAIRPDHRRMHSFILHNRDRDRGIDRSLKNSPQ